MKKILSVFLCVILLLTLVACGADTTATTAPTEAKKEFQVGFGRVNLTPDSPIGLAGYGNASERMHTQVLDYIYLTCVAVRDEQDNTVLFYHADLCTVESNVVSQLQQKVSNAVGVPKENIMVTATHTHSAPRGSGMPGVINQAAIQAAKEAIEDLKPAQMFAGKANTDGINFVRHYLVEDSFVVSDNHGETAGKKILGHATEADEEMRVLQFKREGGKDVVMVNWQSHPHITGGFTATSLSADIIGAFRERLEKDKDCLFAYYQGGAGNINPTSRIAEENANQTSPRNYRYHGELLANTAKEALANMTQLQTGPIKVINETFVADSNQEGRELAAYASDVRAYYEAGHTAAEAAEYGYKNYGIYSIYHATSIANRSELGPTVNVDISAVSFGDFGWAMGPYEMFDASAKFIRDNSPFAFTFATGYTNGGFGYFPTQECWEYGSYEVDTTNVARGTAEALAERFVELLNQLYG